MIVVTNIDYIKVDRDPFEIIRTCGPFEAIEVISKDGQRTAVSANEYRELVKGRKFCHSDGREMIIGFTADCAELLGWPEQAWENMESDNRLLQRRLNDANMKLHSAELAGWRTRLKWLFKGFSA